MAMTPVNWSDQPEQDASRAECDRGIDAPDLQIFVFALFFIFGGITSLNDVIIPQFKELFTLSYFQAMLVQSAFFAAYLFMSLPAAAIVGRFGYMRSAAIGLLTMTFGCVLFIPASASGQFAVFLVALFVLASGITLVQVVVNPLISLLGRPETVPSRLTFAQAFNALGTTVFPYVGALLILGNLKKTSVGPLTGAALVAYRKIETYTVVRTYLGLAIALALVAIIVWSRRNRLLEQPKGGGNILGAFDLFKQPRFAFGALCIFVYVGAEVAIGSVIVNYLMRPEVMGLSREAAGQHLPFYWGGALVGRFIGSLMLRLVSPGKLLSAVALSVIGLLALSAQTSGLTAGWSLLAIGLFNAIMFPTIFSLACEGLGSRAPEGSGLICVAIVGGAIIPPLTGSVADLTNLQFSLLVPAFCYAVIAGFGIFAGNPVRR